MTNPPGFKWVLQIPFMMAPRFTLNEERDAAFAGVNAKLRPASYGYTNVIINGLESEQAARSLFASVRRGFLVASLNTNGGLRVKGEVITIGRASPIPKEVDVPLIYQEDQDLSRILVARPLIGTQFDKTWPRILKGIEFGITSKSGVEALADYHVELALELYADSHFEYSDSARFIGLVGVLEVLKDQSQASEAAQTLVDRWQEAVKTLAAEEAASIHGSLERLKSISISQGIGSVVGRHLGPERVKEVKTLYGMRSRASQENRRCSSTRPGSLPSADVARLGCALAAGRQEHELMACFAAYSGLRRGELAALTTGQIDPSARVVIVDRKVIEIGGRSTSRRPRAASSAASSTPGAPPPDTRWRRRSRPASSRPAPSRTPEPTPSA